VIKIRIGIDYLSSYSQLLYMADQAQDITQEVINRYMKEATI